MSAEMHRVIDRFIDGDMPPVEERDFMRLVEIDDDLRRLYDAERLARATMTKDRGALAEIDHADSYARFLDGLAASARRTSPVAGAVAGEEGESRVATFVALALVVAMIVLLLLPVPGSDTGAPVKESVAPAEIHPHSPLPQAPSGTGGAGVRIPSRAEAVDRNEGRKGSEESAAQGKPFVEMPARDVAAENSRDRSSMKDDAATTPAGVDTSANVERAVDELPVFRDDTVRTRLRVHPDR